MAQAQAYGTKIANSRFGGMRFGNREHKEPLNSEVTTYTLSEEELKQVREGKPLGVKSKGDLERAKKLLKTTDLSPKEIAKKTGAKESTIRQYGYTIRKEKSPDNELQKEINKLEKDTLDVAKTNQELEARMNEMESQMTQLEKHCVDLQHENEALTKDKENLQRDRDNLQHEYNELKLEQHELNDTDHLQIRITQLEADLDRVRQANRENENLAIKLTDQNQYLRAALKAVL